MAGEEQLIGAIDQGTSSSRFLIFSSKTGALITYHQMEINIITPHEGWAEQDPREILASVLDCMRNALANLPALGYNEKAITAIGITNQRETTVLWDRLTGEPFHNAIVWLDVRTASIVDALIEGPARGDKEFLKRKCGLPLSTYFSGPKLKWLFEQSAEGARERIAAAARDGRLCFGTIDSWLLWNLTGGSSGGVHATDVSNASRTMLLNLQTCRWDAELCAFFGVPLGCLPEIRSSAEVFGHVSDDHPLKGVPISGLLGDQHAALLGHHCIHEGDAKNTYGTGCFLLYNVGHRPLFSRCGALTTVAFQLGPDAPVQYALEGSVATAGIAVKWLRDQLGLIQNASDVDTLAATVDSTHGCYFVPAFSGLFCPHWRSDARGIICGLTQFTTKAHIARATLEAVCFQNRELMEAMQMGLYTEAELLVAEANAGGDAGNSRRPQSLVKPMHSVRVDGGMCRSDLLMQMQADICNCLIVRPSMREVTAFGAALAAMHGIGLDTNALPPPLADEFAPQVTPAEIAPRYQKWLRAVRLSMHSMLTGSDSDSDASPREPKSSSGAGSGSGGTRGGGSGALLSLATFTLISVLLGILSRTWGAAKSPVGRR